MKLCGVVGNCAIPPEKEAQVRDRLFCAVTDAIVDGCFYFASGFSSPADILLAEVVISIRAGNPKIYLEAVLPSPDNNLPLDCRHPLCARCNGIRYLLPGRALFWELDRMIGIYQQYTLGEKSRMMEYAYAFGIEFVLIEV